MVTIYDLLLDKLLCLIYMIIGNTYNEKRRLIAKEQL